MGKILLRGSGLPGRTEARVRGSGLLLEPFTSEMRGAAGLSVGNKKVTA